MNKSIIAVYEQIAALQEKWRALVSGTTLKKEEKDKRLTALDADLGFWLEQAGGHIRNKEEVSASNKPKPLRKLPG